MDLRTTALLRLSALASRYGFRSKLGEEIDDIKLVGSVSRTEVYEVFLQIYLFAGFPSGLEATRALQKHWPISDEHSSLPEESNYQQHLERGLSLYEQIYAKNADVVRTEMLKLSPELAESAVVEGYGKILSRPGLDIKTRELAIVAALSQLGWERQLFSHMMGARNVGAEKTEVAEAIHIGAMEDIAKRDRALGLLGRLS